MPRPSNITIKVSASPSTGGSWLRRRFITSFLSAATRSTRIASSARRRYAISAATSSSGKSRLRAIDLSASFRASYRSAVALSLPHTIATAADAVAISPRPTGSGLRSTAFTRTSTCGASTGTSGGNGHRRFRAATTTAAAINSAIPPTVTISRFVILQFDSPPSLFCIKIIFR